MGEAASHPAGPRRIIQNHHMDSTRWDDFPMRNDDIIIATYAKAGTTWLQQIVGQLVFDGADMVGFGDLSPWLEMRMAPKDEVFAGLAEQDNRRFIKSPFPSMRCAGHRTSNISMSPATSAISSGACIAFTAI